VLGEVKSVTLWLRIELKALGLDQGWTFCVAVRGQGTNALGVGIFLHLRHQQDCQQAFDVVDVSTACPELTVVLCCV
jgi:hypothetical protein